MSAIPARQRIFDGIAIVGATLCLIHCLALPALLVLVPAFAAFLTLPDEFHLVALAIAIPTSALALAIGFRSHGRFKPTILAVLGIAFLAVGAIVAPTERSEVVLSVIGAILLAAGHALNWQGVRHVSTVQHSSTPR